jgi:hypothetical protein
MYKTLVILFCFLTMSFGSWLFLRGPDDQEYCDSLVEKLADRELESLLLKFTKEQVISSNLSRSNLIRGGGIRPGEFRVLLDFNWDVLGFYRDAQIRLVSDTKYPVDAILSDIDSVLFSERTRFGLLVKTQGSADFGIKSTSIHAYSESGHLAVVCDFRN